MHDIIEAQCHTLGFLDFAIDTTKHPAVNAFTVILAGVAYGCYTLPNRNP